MHATSTDIPADCVTPLFLSIFFLAQAYCSSLGSRVVDKGICVNDPSAGSPTETLLRLLLPLDDQVCSTSPNTKMNKPFKHPDP